MKYEDVMTMLTESGLPFAYDHFAEGESPDPPFLFSSSLARQHVRRQSASISKSMS
jgi:hypothetical protein